MRKTVPRPFWLKYYMDKNIPTTILVPAEQDYFPHIISPLFEYRKIPLIPLLYNPPPLSPPPEYPPPKYAHLDKFWKHKR